MIYSIDSRKRINHSKSIFIGDSVWIGQGTLLLKGCRIHSGSVIGAESVISNKKIDSNCIAAGNPCRQIKQKIFWEYTHIFTDKDIERVDICQNNDRVFLYDINAYIDFDKIDRLFSENLSAVNKLNIIRSTLKSDKNRFAFYT